VTITSRLRLAGGLLAVLTALPLLSACRTEGNSINTGTNDSSSSDGNATTDTSSYTIGQPVARIVLTARAGHVKVLAKDGAVAVTERAKYTGNKPVTSHAVNGDTLELKEEGCPNREPNAPCQVAWDITAPAGTVLELDTGAGGIEMQGMSGRIIARGKAGGIEGRELRGKQVIANIGAGGIELAFAQTPDEVTAVVGAGGVEITVPSGDSYDVRAKTGAGGKNIEVPQDPNSSHKIKAESGAGGVDITAR
jgi:hypothetical protein